MLSSQAKVGDSQVAVAGHQQIARFQIAVNDPVVVQVRNAAQELVHEVPGVGVREGLRRLNDPMQVAVEQFLQENMRLLWSRSREKNRERYVMHTTSQVGEWK